jgi:histone H3/H4
MAKKKKSTEMLLVASKTKEALKETGCNVSSDALDGLNSYVHWLIEQAAARAEVNGRKTVRAHDFIVG